MIRWIHSILGGIQGYYFGLQIFLPKQLSLFGMQKCLYFEKIGIAFRLQIEHFVLQMRLFGLQLIKFLKFIFEIS